MSDEQEPISAVDEFPPGWYSDPTSRHESRYWDGTSWSQHVLDAGVASVDWDAGLSIAADAQRQRQIAGFWRRLLAFIVDTLVLGAVGFVLGLVFFDFLVAIGPWGRLLGFAIAVAYLGVFNSAIGRGQSLGKGLLKIQVVDRSGEHIPVGRSLLRSSVLAVPWFLNALVLPAGAATVVVTWVLAVLVFGLGVAIPYLYVFNRRTRQSLHDLVAGTFVVSAESTGEVEGTLWKPHLAIATAVVVVCLGLIAFASLSLGKTLSEIEALQQAVQKSGDFHACVVSQGSTATWVGDERTNGTYLSVTVYLKKDPGDLRETVNEVAATVLAEYPDADDVDVISVSASLGYDIGIASAWRSGGAEYSADEWERVLRQAE